MAFSQYRNFKSNFVAFWENSNFTVKMPVLYSMTGRILGIWIFLSQKSRIAISDLKLNCKFFLWKVMVFCYQNCSGLLWEKNVLVIEKNFWNSRLNAENLQKFWDLWNNLFKQSKVRTIFGNRIPFLERIWSKLTVFVPGGFSDIIN